MNRRLLLTLGLTTGLTTGLAMGAAGCSGGVGPEPGPVPDGTPTPSLPSRSPAAPSRSPAGPPAWDALARGLDGLLVRPGDAAYATARQLYNTRFDGLRPAAVAYVGGTEDVRECLAFARRHGTPVAIRNGGHSYAGWSSGTGRLVIDVSKLSRVGTDGADSAVVGAGAKLMDVYRGLARRGRTLPAGTCPTVGISGLALGGGHGVTSRAYGLTCDSLTGATIVTADGRTLVTDAERHPDLFWALRGAGNGNFGVVTELRFRTRPVSPAEVSTVTAYLNWPWSRARAVVAAWQEWGPGQPDEVWSALHLAAGAGGVAPTVSVTAFTLGDRDALQNSLDRLADRVGAPASSVALRDRSHLDAMLVFAGCGGLTDEQCRLPGPVPGRSPGGALGRETYAATSDFFDRSLPAAGVAALTSAVEAFTRTTVARGGGGGSVALTALGGAVNRVDPSATAFVHRGSRMLAQYVASWRPGTPGTVQRAWLRESRAAMGRYASGAAYQNYTDPDLRDWRRAYYGGAADRLTALKRRYDPSRVFTFPQAL
ncbi:FAD-binding oxidoreductase [Streptomyces sp. NPDC047928]|uniref:FAD-binding oxidoreductase n=1 Tax=unclassified Streptomyces TaxID=2593676 RepID=UPI00371ECC0A